MKHLLFIIFLLPITCLAQIRISGTVLNQGDKAPLANASVFLSNATIGTKPDDKGHFELYNVKWGQYELVVTTVGHETYRTNVLVGKDNIALGNILIAGKVTELKEVRVSTDPNSEENKAWERNYQTIKHDLLGFSEFALQCKMLNPEMLDMDYDPQTHKLTAKSYDFLEIENKALGYKIKYLLKSFLRDNDGNFIYFEGSALFEDMEGSTADKRRWQKRRDEVYLGSSMHFLRSLIAGKMDDAGFKILRLVRKKNPKYTPGFNDDKFLQELIDKPLKPEDFFKPDGQQGLYDLYMKECLYIMFSKRKNRSNPNVYKPMVNMPNFATTILTFNDEPGVFDTNGNIINPAAVIIEGTWGNSRIAELLPIDYEPTNIK